MKITFKTFIAEASEFDIEKFMSDCAPFLNAMKGARNLAYRGIQKPVKNWDILSPRKDRKPLDSDEFAHVEMNKFFKETFGWPARSEGLFVTGSVSTAAGYGVTHAVFPIGTFKILWSADMRDPTAAINWEIRRKDDPDMMPDYKPDTSTPTAAERYRLLRQESIEEFIGKMKDFNWETNPNSLIPGLKLDVEIMIKCDKYYAFPILNSEVLRTIVTPRLIKDGILKVRQLR